MRSLSDAHSIMRILISNRQGIDRHRETNKHTIEQEGHRLRTIMRLLLCSHTQKGGRDSQGSVPGRYGWREGGRGLTGVHQDDPQPAGGQTREDRAGAGRGGHL